MSAPLVQARYENLQAVSSTFQEHHDRLRSVHESITAKVIGLKSGGWLADGALTLYREMESDLLPAMGRLCDALAQASTVTLQIAALLQQAEEEAALHLNTAEAAFDTQSPFVAVNLASSSPVYTMIAYNVGQRSGDQNGDEYPDPRDFVRGYQNFDFWGWIGLGQVFDLDEERFAADLVSRYLNGNPPSAADIAFVRSVLREVGLYDQSEAATAVYRQLMAQGNTAWLAQGGRDVRALAMQLINGMQAPVGYVSSMYGYGGGSFIPASRSALELRDMLIIEAFPQLASLAGEPWFSGSQMAQYQASVAAVNGGFQRLDERGGPIVFDRFETTLSIPPGVSVQQYFEGILANSPSSVAGSGFNNITQFSPNPNSQPFSPPIAGNVGLGSVFDIDFLQPLPNFGPPGAVDGGVMLVDAQLGSGSGYFTYQALTIEGRTLPEFGARQFGYQIEGVDANGNQIVTIYTQATSRPSDPFTEIGGDIFQPLSWQWWLRDVGNDFTQNGQAGAIIDTQSFTTGATD